MCTKIAADVQENIDKLTLTPEQVQTWMEYMNEIGEVNAIIEKIKFDLAKENKKNHPNGKS